MKESVRAALTFLRSHGDEFGVAEDALEEKDLHIHVPAGAIPKDGPSAGITMATAILSLLTERPVKRDVAMTGEITLRGRVMTIGGLKEKCLAALRLGIKTVLIPKGNEVDIAELPKEVRRGLNIYPCEHIREESRHLRSERRGAAGVTERAPDRSTRQRAGATETDRPCSVQETTALIQSLSRWSRDLHGQLLRGQPLPERLARP